MVKAKRIVNQVLGGRDHHEKLGTFLGVFTPAFLTFLGLILFLRAPGITRIIALSAAYIATNLFGVSEIA